MWLLNSPSPILQFIYFEELSKEYKKFHRIQEVQIRGQILPCTEKKNDYFKILIYGEKR